MRPVSSIESAAMARAIQPWDFARRRFAAGLAWGAVDNLAAREAGRKWSKDPIVAAGVLVMLVPSLEVRWDHATLRAFAELLGRPTTPWDDWLAAARKLLTATKVLWRYVIRGVA